MANENHLNILKQEIEGWNKWRKKNFLVKPNLSGANLEEIDLRGANLRRVNLNGANLANANLENVDLYQANLGHANLCGAKLSGANLEYANLSKANLQEADLSKTRLSYSILTEANIEGALLEEAQLHNARLRKSNLKNSNLGFSELTDAKFTGANLDDCILIGAIAERSTFKKVKMRNAKVNNAIFKSANFKCANLNGTDFSGTNLHSANFECTDLSGTDFSEMDLHSATFYRAELKKCNFYKADLSHANFIKANLQEANLEQVNLFGAHFKKANMESSIIINAQYITYVQLSQVKTLYNAIITPSFFRKQLVKDFPALFQTATDQNFKEEEKGKISQENFIKRAIEIEKKKLVKSCDSCNQIEKGDEYDYKYVFSMSQHFSTGSTLYRTSEYESSDFICDKCVDHYVEEWAEKIKPIKRKRIWGYISSVVSFVFLAISILLFFINDFRKSVDDEGLIFWFFMSFISFFSALGFFAFAVAKEEEMKIPPDAIYDYALSLKKSFLYKFHNLEGQGWSLHRTSPWR